MLEFLRFMNPPTMERPPGYSNVVEIKGDARIVFFAGQLGVDTAANSSARREISRRRPCRRSRT